MPQLHRWPTDRFLGVNAFGTLDTAGSFCASENPHHLLLANMSPDTETLFALARLYTDREQSGEAINAYRRLLTLSPDHLPARQNLTNLLISEERLDEALEHCRQILSSHPDFAPARLSLANLRFQQGRVADAIDLYRQTIVLLPDNASLYDTLGNALNVAGRNREAVDAYWKAIELSQGNYNAYVVALFNQHYDATCTPERTLERARLYGQALMVGVTPYEHRTPLLARSDARKLRIGFTSADLRQHPVTHFLENVLAHLDFDKLELHAYSLTTTEDQTTERIKPYFASWKLLTGHTPEQCARMIRDDRIDILVDLSGHTLNSGLPLYAWKPAPVQLTWIGYFASTGVPTMDYIVGDRYVLPTTERHHFVEAPWPLPNGYLCFKTPPDHVPIGPPPSIAAGHVTFGCFNNLLKMNDRVVTAWARALHAIPGSRLMLKTKEMKFLYHRTETLRRFAAHGIGADRLVIEGSSPRGEYFARYDRVDVALDPFPYNGGTTTVETLWMGVPVVVLKGDRFVGHMGEGILHHLGHPEWIAENIDQYVELAVKLAQDTGLRAALRRTLRSELAASPLCDGPGFARQLETAFEAMWQRHRARTGLAPAHYLAAQLESAVALQRDGHFDQAAHLYQHVLEIEPCHAEANHNLGLLMVQQNRAADSIPFFKAALEAAPERPDFRAIYIEALKLAGQHEASGQGLEVARQLSVGLD